MVIYKNSPRFKFAINIFLPIFIGTTIYALFRGLNFIDSSHNYFPMIYISKIPDWVIYNLPDGLWFYGLLSTISFVWRDYLSKYFILWIILSVFFTYLSEVFQGLKIIPGTYDFKDLIAYSIALLLFCILNFNQIIKQLSTFKNGENEN